MEPPALTELLLGTITALNEGDVIRADVVDVEDNGIYLRQEGLDGFVNVTHVTWKQGRVDPRDHAKTGDRLEVRVYAVTADRFYASIKDLHPEDNPWSDPGVYAPGSHHHGVAREVTPFGALVELGTGAMGLVPGAPEAHGLAAGDAIEVTVVSADPSLRKIALRRAGDGT